jgi:L,D-transpeptidase catalytic domain/Putative peptidoglycan binding domain
MMRVMRRFVVIVVALATLALPATAHAALHYGSRGPLVAAVQKRLITLTFLDASSHTGVFGHRTEQAVMGFQGWAGLARDGVVGTATFRALAKAHVPWPLTRAYKHIEIFRNRQVMLLIDRHRHVVRSIHVSTGRPGLATPAGNFHVYRKETLSWSVPFQAWLPYANYFYGGYAIHQFASVPGYPASHGCVRVAKGDSIVVWFFAKLGTPVLVR